MYVREPKSLKLFILQLQNTDLYDKICLDLWNNTVLERSLFILGITKFVSIVKNTLFYLMEETILFWEQKGSILRSQSARQILGCVSSFQCAPARFFKRFSWKFQRNINDIGNTAIIVPCVVYLQLWFQEVMENSVRSQLKIHVP